MTEQQVQEQTKEVELSPEEKQYNYEVEMVKRAVDSNSVQLPENFKSVEDWVSSFKETRAKLTKTEQTLKELQQPEDNAEPPAAPAPDTNTVDNFADSLADDDPPPSNAPAIDWDSVQKEILRSGKISDETQAALDKANIPKTLVQAAMAGFQAHQKSVTEQAANIVGGQENLSKMTAWAKANLPKEKREALSQQLKQPGWEITLQGLYTQWQQSGAAVETIHGETAVPNSNAEPFKSQSELVAAIQDKRYRQGGEYTQLVQERIRATHAANAQRR